MHYLCAFIAKAKVRGWTLEEGVLVQSPEVQDLLEQLRAQFEAGREDQPNRAENLAMLGQMKGYRPNRSGGQRSSPF